MSHELSRLELASQSTKERLEVMFSLWGEEKMRNQDLDMKSPDIQKTARYMADQLIEVSDGDMAVLNSLESWACDPELKDQVSSLFHLSIKLAISKVYVQQISEPTDVAFVVPVYHEVTRIRPRDLGAGGHTYPVDTSIFPPHPHGEDFVTEKKRQADWLFGSNSLIKHRFIYVDDGCDLQSGHLVQQIINRNSWGSSHEVLFLQDVIQSQKSRQKGLMHEAVREFKNPKDSQKAGAIYVGMAQAVVGGADVIICCDADLSYNLGLSGRLISPIVNDEASAAVVNRRDELSILEEPQSIPNNPGKVRVKAMIGSLRKALLGDLLPPDTQPGFKAFSREAAEKIVSSPNKERGFSFDVQVLSRCATYSNKKATSVPVVCLDSSDETTADNDRTYFEMLRTFVRVAREEGRGSNEVIEVLTDISYDYGTSERVIWRELGQLMAADLENESDIAGHNVENIRVLQRRFDVKGNSTSSSVNLEPDDLVRLKHLVGEIKAKNTQTI